MASDEDKPTSYEQRAQPSPASHAHAADAGDRSLFELLDGLHVGFALVVREATDEDALYQLQVQYLGKKGSVTGLRSQMGSIPPGDRKAFGQAFNEVKQAIEAGLEARKHELEGLARARELERRVDLSFVAARSRAGSLHPITATRRALEQVFRRLGFDVLEGPHVEAEDFNFDKLAFEPDHPARDTQDTFFVLGRGQQAPPTLEGDRVDPTRSLVLRTHTSPVQVRTMLTQRPPIRIVAPGTVFRVDDDATHSPMFNQIEGLYIDEGVTMADLKATLYRFVGAFFGTGLEVRFRPSYFPFVEPGAEFDMQCPFCRDGEGGPSRGCNICKQTGWVELGGAGMVDPAVFEHCGIDSEVYTGWAFGFGIDRMAMLRYAVPNLKLFFEGDLRFLEQYPC